MPGRGIGAGIFEGLTYLQQRSDALAQQAEEMALRNAVQRLNSEEFKYKRQRDSTQDMLKAQQQDFENTQTEKDFGLKERGLTLQEKNTDERLRQGDERIKQSQQRIDMAAQQFASKLDTQRQGQFLQQYRFLISQGYEPSDALADAMARTHAEAATSPQGTPQGTPQTPSQPQANVLPQQNPLDMIPGLSAPPAGQSEGMGGAPQIGLPGVSPKAEMDMKAKAATVVSRQAYAQQIQQRYEQNAAMFGIKKAAAIAQKELAEARKAEAEERIKRMKAMLPYDELLKSYGVQNAITRQEIDKLRLLSAQEDREWMKQMGGGSATQSRIQQQAESRAGVLFSKETTLHKEAAALNRIATSYRAVTKQPLPNTTDPKYAERMNDHQLARQFLPGLEARGKEIQQDLLRVKELQKNNNRFRNLSIQTTTTGGRPEAKPGLPKITSENLRPMPTRKATRPNTYSYKGQVGGSPPKKKALKDLTTAELDAMERAAKAKRR